MKNCNYGMVGWFVRLMVGVCLVVFMSGNTAAWDITANSITNNSGKTGRIYLSVLNQYNNGVAGGSLPFDAITGTVHGVPTGSYTLNTFIDTQGTGFQHANDPALSFPITVAGNGGGDLVFNVPVAVPAMAPSAPDLMPLDGAVFVNFRPATTVSTTSNGLPIADKHTIYWGTNSDTGPGKTTGGGSLAIFNQEPMVVISNLVNGTSYYFAVRAENQNSTSTAMSPVSAAVTPVASSPSASTVNVTVNTTGITKNAQSMLIVILSDDKDGFAFNYVKNPADIQVVSVTGVPAGTYKILTVLNPSGSGDFFAADNISNFSGIDRNQRGLPITVDGVTASVAAPTISLAVKNSAVAVSTNHSRSNGSDNYSLRLEASSMSKQLVNVRLDSGPQITGPIDLPMGGNKEQKFSVSLNVPNRPTVEDNYQLTMFYADDTSEIRTAAVTAVLDTFPGVSFPSGSTGPASVTPTFGWNNPGNLPGFVSTNINMNFNDFDFLPLTTLSVRDQYNSFSLGQISYWNRGIRDLDGNEATLQSNFTPSASGPVISELSRTSGAGGAGGVSVTISGSGFSATPANNTVKFNGTVTDTPTSVSPTSLTVTAPASSGVITVTVGGVTAGSIAPFAATTSYTGQITDGTAGGTMSGVAVSLVENPAVTINTDGSGNYTLLQVPAKPYFTLKISDPVYSPYYTHSALQTASGGATYPGATAGNWSLYTATELTNRGVLPAAGKGLIAARVIDYTNAVTTNYLAGAVVRATSLIHPDVPYIVKYTDGATTVAQDPASITMTGADGRFYVPDVDEGDYVTVTASNGNMGFNTRVFNTHADGIGVHSIRGATPTIPTASPAGGSYGVTQSVTLSIAPSTVDEIYYTTNGSDPVTLGQLYSVAIPISTDTTLKFVSKNKNVPQAYSAVQTEVYSIGASIAGQVTDANTTNPIQFVSVQLYDQNGSYPPLNSTNTDNSGNYKFSGLAANTYKVCFYTGQSYVSQCWQNTSSNPASATPIGVTTIPVTGISAALQTGAIITGRVTRDGINGINNVSINVYDNNGNPVPAIAAGNTNSNGDYTLNGLPSGTYKLYFNGQNVGYISQWYLNKVDPASADPIPVTAGNTYSGINVQLVQGGSISGQVTNIGSTGIQNVNVQLRDTNGFGIPGANGANTIADGTYTITGIPPGSYKIYFDATSTGYIGQWFNGVTDQSSATTLVVTAGGSLTSKNAILAQGGTITGKITRDGVNGIQNVSVQVRDTNGNGFPNINGATTDASGNYSLGGIPSGSYKIYFDGQSTGYISQWFNNVTDQSAASTIVVTAGFTYPGYNAQLAQGSTIAGTVTTNGVTGIQNVSVQLYNSTGMTNLSNANTNAAGGYQFNGLQAGTYKVCFTPGQTNYIAQCYYNLANDPANATGIPLMVPGGNGGVNATMTLGGGISGQVTDGSSGIQNINVEVRDTSGNTIPNVFGPGTDLSGNYTIRGIPAGGNVKVFFNSNGTSYANQWYNNKTSSASADLVPISAGVTNNLATAILPLATVPGTPTINSITPGNGQATVNFTAPASNGGRRINNYTVTANPGPPPVTSAGSPITVYGLTSGQQYTISVTATNNLGSSPAATTPYYLPWLVYTGNDLQSLVNFSAADGAIWAQAGIATVTTPPLSITKGVTISGGYSSDFSTVNGYSTIPGRVNITGTPAFKVIFKNIKVKTP